MNIYLHPLLRRFNEGRESFAVFPCRLEELLAQLAEQCPSLKQYLFNSYGQLSGYINIYINGQNYRTLDKQMELQKTDKVEILTSLVGG